MCGKCSELESAYDFWVHYTYTVHRIVNQSRKYLKQTHKLKMQQQFKGWLEFNYFSGHPIQRLLRKGAQKELNQFCGIDGF